MAAVVENSHDAILSKTLDGVIQSWNPAAERLFGYRAEEIVGRSVLTLIPEERQGEEDDILARLRRGERIEHIETVRRRKDGELIEVALTVSPVRDSSGAVIGASKIARDISHTRRSAERQSLLLREMHHRIKNLFAMVAGLVVASARDAVDVSGLVRDLNGRIAALSRAHALTLPDLTTAETDMQPTPLKGLLAALVAPHEGVAASIAIEGDDHDVSSKALPMLALLLHELATNAAKYGALSHPAGHLKVAIRRMAGDGAVEIEWSETGGAQRADVGAGAEGFGSLLERTCLKGLGGTLDRTWTAQGLVIVLRAPIERLSQSVSA
ncbi:PAS domain S-box protein [Brevundimonas sp.]|uniref:PAS domain S-box protein n=1 Tax=Brevundimonas sp. TaxID=1871086 RepID=UPI0037C096B9